MINSNNKSIYSNRKINYILKCINNNRASLMSKELIHTPMHKTRFNNSHSLYIYKVIIMGLAHQIRNYGNKTFLPQYLRTS